MSLAIQISKVRRVLLSDGWHDVEGNSFDLDSYEFMCGPLSSIQAVETFPRNT